MRTARLALAFILLMLITGPTIPAAAQQIALDQLSKATRTYFRDSAEFPMRMAVDFSVIDASGRVRKHKTGKFDYTFHGYNPRSQHGAVELRGPKSSLKAAVTAAVAAMLPGFLVAPKIEENYHLSEEESVVPDVVWVKLAPIPPCQSSPWLADGYLLEEFCGPSQAELQKEDLSIKHFTFEAAALPVQANIDFLGPTTVRRYRVDVDFQKVLIPSDSKPFLVPKLIIVTAVTDKGRLLIRSDFIPRK